MSDKIQEETDQSQPLVSIIMPTYKQTALLYKAVESVLSQTYKNFELIVIDDNYDESFRKENQKYFQNKNNLKINYFQNEKNLGSAQSRNKGIQLASGEYITFLDDDDVYDQFKVERQIILMLKKNLDISVCNLILTNEKGRVTDKRKRRYLKRGEDILTAHLKYHITGTDTLMFKKEFLKKIGGFDNQDLGDEFYLMAKAFENKPKFAHLDYDGVFATVHTSTGLSSGDNKIKTEKILWGFKSKYFNSLKSVDVRYIKMRHYLVLAVAHKKNKDYKKCFLFLWKSFFCAPIGMFRIVFGVDR